MNTKIISISDIEYFENRQQKQNEHFSSTRNKNNNTATKYKSRKKNPIRHRKKRIRPNTHLLDAQQGPVVGESSGCLQTTILP